MGLGATTPFHPSFTRMWLAELDQAGKPRGLKWAKISNQAQDVGLSKAVLAGLCANVQIHQFFAPSSSSSPPQTSIVHFHHLCEG